jgi:UDPglucose 6-dehydrogenase
MGANVNMVRKGIGSDSRIGNKFIYPGIAMAVVFPKGCESLIRTARENGYQLRVLQSVEDVNDTRNLFCIIKLWAFQGRY